MESHTEKITSCDFVSCLHGFARWGRQHNYY
jgi:hypothetical protein